MNKMGKYLFAVVLLIVAACNGCKDKVKDTPDVPEPTTIAAPQPITYVIDNVYPHDTAAFTEGLEIYNGKFYESTGLNNKSTLRIVDIKTGQVEKKHLITDTSIFGEGITIFKDKLYQLTWTSHKAFVYNVSDITKPIKTLNWPHEGWGMTHDDSRLIISDGSSNIYFVSPDDLHVLKTISVADNTGAEDRINELELINGFIYANRWETDDIFKIDTSNGHIVGKMNFTGLLSQYAAKEITNETNYLNGIAYDSMTKKLYINGKNWPKIFEIRLNN
jgi:glutaminyl-peptide cyclotransferase